MAPSVRRKRNCRRSVEHRRGFVLVEVVLHYRLSLEVSKRLETCRPALPVRPCTQAGSVTLDQEYQSLTTTVSATFRHAATHMYDPVPQSGSVQSRYRRKSRGVALLPVRRVGLTSASRSCPRLAVPCRVVTTSALSVQSSFSSSPLPLPLPTTTSTHLGQTHPYCLNHTDGLSAGK